MREMNAGYRYTLRRFAVSAFVMLLSCVAFADMEDMVLRFSTPGQDTYSDGTAVADGECYALVWSPAGASFSGFKADGTTVSTNDLVVFAAPLAKGGRCRATIFQIPKADYAALQGGVLSVCLVDTRRADGSPAGVAGNAPRRVNRWGIVKGDVKADVAGASGLGAVAARTKSGAAEAVVADVVSEVPDSARRPKVTSVSLADGRFRVAVADTVPYLTYTLKSGGEPDDLAPDAAAGRADGDAGAEIEIEAPGVGDRMFFGVTRAQ